ncbi:MAG: hypothetical protein IT223_07965 [Crocinitomicaceae bacterium]|nr:hypothetical protein [Crocinitomicaceae bacterium]
MKKAILSFFISHLLIFITAEVNAQGVGINPNGNQPDPSAALDIAASDKGLLIPRLTTAQRDAIGAPAIGLQIFNIDTNCFNFWDGQTWRKSCYECDFETPSIGNNGPICEGLTLQLTCTSIPGATYQWSGPNSFSSSLQNPSITSAGASASGVYSLLVTVNNCTANAVTTNATVNALPQTPIADSNSPRCAGSTLNLTANNIVGASYIWTGPNDFASTAQNPSVNDIQSAGAGDYHVQVSVNGCVSASDTETVDVNANPVSPSVGSNTPVCIGNTLNLTASSLAGASYNWTGPHGFSDTAQNPTLASVTNDADGLYTVVLTDSNGCSATPASTNVTINSSIPSSPVVGSNSPVCENSTLNLTASTISGATYNWTGPNGFNSTTQNPSIPSITVGGAGNYSVTASINGCTSSASFANIIVNAASSGSQTFDYSGSIVTWSVPVCISEVNIEVWGAQGGNAGGQQGGKGARMKGDFSVTAGQQLKILVGQQGTAAIDNESQAGGSGGGGSFVATSTDTPLIVAGGGGGAISYNSPSQGGNAPTTESGITGGGNDGGAGGTSGNGGSKFSWSGWHGGTGGAGFYGDGVGMSGGNISFGTPMSSGTSFVNGGAGGNGGSNGRNGGFGGGGASGFTGGGGGGYSGGGGGGFQGSLSYCGGGGGSFNSGSNPDNTSGVKTGNGQIIISW